MDLGSSLQAPSFKNVGLGFFLHFVRVHLVVILAFHPLIQDSTEFSSSVMRFLKGGSSSAFFSLEAIPILRLTVGLTKVMEPPFEWFFEFSLHHLSLKIVSGNSYINLECLRDTNG